MNNILKLVIEINSNQMKHYNVLRKITWKCRNKEISPNTKIDKNPSLMKLAAKMYFDYNSTKNSISVKN